MVVQWMKIKPNIRGAMIPIVHAIGPPLNMSLLKLVVWAQLVYIL